MTTASAVTEPSTESPTESPADTGFPKFYIKHHGRNYRLFKRSDSRDAPWYLYFERRRRRYLYSCKTNAKETAIMTAKLYIDAVESQNQAAVQALLSRTGEPERATVGQLIAALERLPGLEIADRTRADYINCLRNVLSRVHGPEPDRLSTTLLNEATAEKWFELATERAKLAPDQGEAVRIKRSANSLFNQARGAVAPFIAAKLAKTGLALPDFAPFHHAFKQYGFRGVKSQVYRLPSDALVQRTLEEWKKLADRNQFLAVGLMLSCGLRAGELPQVCWGWIRQQGGVTMLSNAAQVKNQSGYLEVRPIDPYWSTLLRIAGKHGWRGAPEETILQGTDTEKSEGVTRGVSAWMRELGWETTKTNHALRAYAGGQVAMKYGIWSASGFLRHSSVLVTEQHYLYLIKSRTTDPDQIPITWAK